MFPQTQIGFAAIKTFLGTAKGIFWIFFVVLFLFIVLGKACHQEPEVHVTVAPTPSIEPTLITKVLASQDQVIKQDLEEQAKTEEVVEEVKETVRTVIKVIREDKTLTSDVKLKKIGEAQITALDDLYQQYYGPSNPSNSEIEHE